MRTIVWEGTLTALSGVAHVGEGGGRVHVLRREKVLTGQGVASVPVVSGAVVRGRLRRMGASLTAHVLGQGLPVGAALALSQGGVLAETRSGRDVLTGERQARLRRLVPLLGLFGTAGGGRVMPGRLLVGKAVPVGAETLPLLPGRVREELTAGGRSWPSVYELVGREAYSTLTDYPTVAAITSPGESGDLEGLDGGGPMRYEIETLVAGTVFYHQVVAEDVTGAEADLAVELMGLWGRRALLGGGRARGMGRVACDYQVSVSDPAGAPAALEGGDWRAAMLGDVEATRQALSWL